METLSSNQGNDYFEPHWPPPFNTIPMQSSAPSAHYSRCLCAAYATSSSGEEIMGKATINNDPQMLTFAPELGLSWRSPHSPISWTSDLHVWCR